MNGYYIRLEINAEEVKQILSRLEEAQKTILDCYEQLERLGVLKIRENGAASN